MDSVLSEKKYQARAKAIQYSNSFAGAAAGFLIAARNKLGVSIDPDIFRPLLLIWGVTLFSGFAEYILSYRQTWYHQQLPKGLRKAFIPKIEISLLYAAMIVHPVAMLCAIVYSVYALWWAF